jgi:hypothetical protein
MFKRILYEEWHAAVPIIAFILTFAVFVFFVARALLLHRDEVGRLAALPLDFDESLSEEVDNA